MNEISFGSLFAGIGGIDLGFERAGLTCKWQVEIDDYATRVLEKHWPNVHRERDIRKCGRTNLERVDVICGGFPCQDISYAGRGAGLDGERSGLFFEAIRLVRELQPRAVVLENVAGLLTRGLDRVLGTLAEVGFDAEWHCIPAAAVGAPHIRDRVFVLGWNTDCREQGPQRGVCGWSNANTSGACETVADSDDGGLAIRRVSQNPVQKRDKSGTSQGDGKQSRSKVEAGSVLSDHLWPQRKPRSGRWRVRQGNQELAHTNSQRSETGLARQKPREKRDTGVVVNQSHLGCWRQGCSFWATEPDVGRVANGIPKRMDRLRGLGNAVVPQVAEFIGHHIREALRTKYRPEDQS